MSFESLLQTGVLRCRFMGLTQNGSLMLLATRGGGLCVRPEPSLRRFDPVAVSLSLKSCASVRMSL
jgi:hypothetical protein